MLRMLLSPRPGPAGRLLASLPRRWHRRRRKRQSLSPRSLSLIRMMRISGTERLGKGGKGVWDSSVLWQGKENHAPAPYTARGPERQGQASYGVIVDGCGVAWRCLIVPARICTAGTLKFWELQDAESYDPAALQRLENTFRLPLFTQVSSVDRGSVPIVFGFPLSIRVCNKFSAASHWAERRLTAGKTSLRGKKNLPVMTLSVRKNLRTPPGVQRRHKQTAHVSLTSY